MSKRRVTGIEGFEGFKDSFTFFNQEHPGSDAPCYTSGT